MARRGAVDKRTRPSCSTRVGFDFVIDIFHRKITRVNFNLQHRVSFITTSWSINLLELFRRSISSGLLALGFNAWNVRHVELGLTVAIMLQLVDVLFAVRIRVKLLRKVEMDHRTAFSWKTLLIGLIRAESQIIFVNSLKFTGLKGLIKIRARLCSVSMTASAVKFGWGTFGW